MTKTPLLTKLVILLSLSIYNTESIAQATVNLDQFDKKGAVKVEQQSNLLKLNWDIGDNKQGYLSINLAKDLPLIAQIAIDKSNEFCEIASDLDPAFLVTVGQRSLKRNGWTVFCDNPSHRSHQTYSLALDKKSVALISDGNRCQVQIGEATAGPLTGTVNLELFRGSPLVKVSAKVSTSEDSLAIIYDAGFTGQPWKEVFWSDTEGFIQSDPFEENAKAKPLKVKYRTIVGESEFGSLAVFPAPHQYFYPLDNAYNEKHVWHGTNYRGLVKQPGIGIRHELLGDRRWVPWFNAPPGTLQDLSFFCLISTENDGKALEKVKRYTHNDTYLPLDGYYTMSSHFHQEHTDDVLTHKPLPEIPGFVKAFRNTGVNIIHMGEFHLEGNPKGPAVKRLEQQKIFFDECARLSKGNFLLLPGEEPNNWFGGHWMNIFPNPVYWIMSREEDQPFVEEDPRYGKVYRISSQAEMQKLLELENGLAWTAHARIKGSIGYPDKYKDQSFYQSDHFLGAAWKPMPADLSQPELGSRVLDLMDDMANWGSRKKVIAEADLFKIEPDYELYAHLNVNYIKLDKLPKFEDGWPEVLETLKSGNFFSTTGEILLPGFTVNGKAPCETVALDARGKAEIHLKAHWTFPLNYLEIISGDGSKVYKEVISMNETFAFGEQEWNFSVDLSGRKWVRIEVWDVAANGAFTQIVWLK